MTTNEQKLALLEVHQEMRDKLDLVILATQDMEEAKAVRTLFIQRLNTFLLASGSVTMIVKRQGERYARQVGKGQQFIAWYKHKEDLFRTPDKGKKGTDPIWIFLEAARDVTTHQQQVKPQDAYRATKTLRVRFHLQVEGEPAQPELPQQALPLGINLVEEAVRNDEKVYLFKPLLIWNRGKLLPPLQPPNDDVITVCKNHIKTLETFLKECKAILE